MGVGMEGCSLQWVQGWLSERIQKFFQRVVWLDAACQCYIETAENSMALPQSITVTVIKVIMNRVMQELDGDRGGVAAYEK